MGVVTEVGLINQALHVVRECVDHVRCDLIGQMNQAKGVGLFQFSLRIDGSEYDLENRRGEWFVFRTLPLGPSMLPVKCQWFMDLLRKHGKDLGDGVVQQSGAAGQPDSGSGSEVHAERDGRVRNQSGDESSLEGQQVQ